MLILYTCNVETVRSRYFVLFLKNATAKKFYRQKRLYRGYVDRDMEFLFAISIFSYRRESINPHRSRLFCIFPARKKKGEFIKLKFLCAQCRLFAIFNATRIYKYSCSVSEQKVHTLSLYIDQRAWSRKRKKKAVEKNRVYFYEKKNLNEGGELIN